MTLTASRSTRTVASSGRRRSSWRDRCSTCWCVSYIICNISPLNCSCGRVFLLQVQASDNGLKIQRNDTTRVTFTVIPRPAPSPHPPVFDTHEPVESLFEDFDVGKHLPSPVATDEDGDQLWYSIVAGNVDDTFAIDKQTGSIVLARPLDREQRASYNLTLQASDCSHSATTTVSTDSLFVT